MMQWSINRSTLYMNLRNHYALDASVDTNTCLKIFHKNKYARGNNEMRIRIIEHLPRFPLLVNIYKTDKIT